MKRVIEKTQLPAPPIPKLTRVAAYARVSSGKDAMLHSLSAQVSYYNRMIQNHPGWIFCGVYADEALTGTRDTREQFQRLLSDCRAGKIDLVVTKSISRFARNTLTLLQTVRELKALGLDVYFEEQNIHSLSSDGELILTILASYAQEESLSASENQKWRIRKGFENGELVNLRFLYGYRISKNGISIHKQEAAIVREVYHRAIEGESFGGIASDLNRRKIDCALDGKWATGRIREMLRNEKYCGNALLQKRYRNNHLEKKLIPNDGVLPQYYAEGTHEPIIDLDTFALAQRIVDRNKVNAGSQRPREQSPFTSKIVCGNCGKHYKRITNYGKKAWNCSTFQQRGKAECPARQIPEEELYRLATEVLGKEEFDADAFLSRITAVRAENDCALVFCFKDGTQTVKRWIPRSRRNSWTPEMREATRQRELQRRQSV